MQRAPIICSLVAALALAEAAFATEPLQVGWSQIDITPPAGLRMSGYFSERLSTGQHDPLYAKATVLEQGETRIALVICDLIGIPANIARQARDLAEKKTGIPAENIVIAATHSHTGPMFAGALRKHLHDQAIARHGKDAAEEFDFPAHLVNSAAEAIVEAVANVKPVILQAGIGEERRLSFNRRFHMKDGSVRFNPGRNNPDIVRVAGPIDPEVGLLLFADAETKKPLASLSVFALHLDTVGGTEYSADYPHYLARDLQKHFGKDFVSLFGTGTCGDINHIDVSKADQLHGQPEAERIGTALAETVRATADKLAATEKPALAVRRAVVDVPLQQYSAEQIAAAAANMHKIGTRELSFLEQVETNKITDLHLHYPGKTHSLEVQVIRLSPDTAIVCLPAEVFVELGIAIKTASPFERTLVIELCNDVPAYIPTRKAFAEGSYETVNSRVAPGGGEAMVDAAVKLLRDLWSAAD